MIAKILLFIGLVVPVIIFAIGCITAFLDIRRGPPHLK